MALRDGQGASDAKSFEPRLGGSAGQGSAARFAGAGACAPRAFSADELKSLLDVAGVWLWETDAEHRFSWLSADLEALTGIEAAALIGRSRLDFLKCGDGDTRTAEGHVADLEARRPFRGFSCEVRDATPACRWVSISGEPRFDPQGLFLGYRGTGRNVTPMLPSLAELARAQGQQARHEGRETVLGDRLASASHIERMMNALDVMADAFCYYDSEDRLVLYNAAMIDMHRGLEDVIRPGLTYRALIEAGLKRGLWDRGHVSEAEWQEAALGRRRYRRPTRATVRFADGRFAMYREMPMDDGGTIAISTDITAQKLHEAKLERARCDAEAARQRLQSAIDGIEDGFVLWDQADRMVVCNRAFRREFASFDGLAPGRTFAEMLTDFVAQGFVAEARGREEEWLRDHLETRERELGHETVTFGRDGRWKRQREQPTEAGDRVGIRTDVTELKQKQAETDEANERNVALLADLQRTLDAMTMGIVLLDKDMKADIINKAFHDLWKLRPGQVGVGSPFRALMDINRHNGIYDIADERWEDYVAWRVEEIMAGDVAPREFERADGRTMVYSVTALSGGKRLVCYYDISDIKEREAQLAEALEKSRLAAAVINGLKEPVYVKDGDLRFVIVNAAFAAMFGREPEAMIGLGDGDFFSAEEAEVFAGCERAVLTTGVAREFEEASDYSGAGRSRMVRQDRVRTESGKDYLACFVFDVTDMKRRGREAEEARQHLANVLDSLPAGVIIYDGDDRFVLANKELRGALPALAPVLVPGKSFREAIEYGHSIGYFRASGDPALDALYDRDPQAWLDGYLTRHRMRHAAFERENADGRWYQVFDSWTDDGTFVGVRVDITELKQREAQLKESLRANELYQSLIDNVPVAIYAKRPDLKLIYVNDSWCELTGHTKDEAIGRTDAEIFGVDGEAFMEGDRAVLATGEKHEIEETVTEADGACRWQIARKSAMVASDGSPYLIGSTTDITELKRREQELREAQSRAVLADRAKSEFLANMSHEIRTPMNGVLGMAELLAKSNLDSKQKTFTDVIVKSGHALLTIINDILDFSKIDAGQLMLDPAPFNLAEAVEDVATLVSARAKEKDLELIVRIEPKLHGLYVGDVGRIRQIITNLVGNAVKFTEAGHILIEVTGESGADETRLRIGVTDTGIGIPKDKLQLVFEKFSQVDGSSTRRHEGTGLGLAITSRLVALMGGEVGVESTEGAGSTFWFTLTLPNGEKPARADVTPIDVSGARILIVDDNHVNRSILGEQMASWGFDACAAESGAEGLKVLDAAARFGFAVDCVILDYQMPGMTGAEVARLIRATPSIAATPIVMLTSVDQSLSNVAYRDIGIDAHLIKPARSSVLLETLVAIIQKRRATTAYDRAPRSAPKLAPPPWPDATTAAVAAPPAVPATPAAAHRLDILVAEDNEVNQLVFTQILGETGLSFEIVGNGRRAVESWREINPRMILMDVSMPEMNGLQATAAIREAEAGSGRHVPIIGVTAHALKGDRERCLEAGMDDYLPKPISPRALLQKVERWSRPAGEGGRQAG